MKTKEPVGDGQTHYDDGEEIEFAVFLTAAPQDDEHVACDANCQKNPEQGVEPFVSYSFDRRQGCVVGCCHLGSDLCDCNDAFSSRKAVVDMKLVWAYQYLYNDIPRHVVV